MSRRHSILITVLTIVVVYLVFFVNNKAWNHHVSGGGDSWGYYAYLPALFIQKDLKTLDKTIAVRKAMYPNNVQTVNDTLRVGEAPAHGAANVLKYTCGVALLNIVPFAAAHGYTLLTDPESANGFTQAYRFALYLNALLFIFAGLWLIWKVLEPRFGNRSALLTVAVLGLATNLFYFGVLNNVMAHPFLFTLWAALIYGTDQLYKHPGRRWAALIGVAAGLITLIRPTECISLLVPLLWDFKSVGARWRFILEHKRLVMVLIICFAVCAMPQLLYWKYVTGQWIYYSYTDEGFNFLAPRIFEGFFSFRNGWLIYSPAMILSILGIAVLFTRKNSLRFVVPIVLLIHAYLAFSWWNWYYINGFGMRVMVELLPLMAIPLAALFRASPKGLRYVLYVFVLVAIVLNVFQTEQHRKGVMWTQNLNAAYYRQALGKMQMDQRMSVAYDLHTYQRKKVTPVTSLLVEGFEGKEYTRVSTAFVKNGMQSYRITPDAVADFGEHQFDLDQRGYKPGDLLSISCWIYVEKQISQYFDMTSFNIAMKRNGQVYRQRYLRLNNKPGEPGKISLWWGVPREWYYLEAQYRIPSNYQQGDALSLSLLAPSPRTVVFMDDLEVQLVR